MGAQPSAEIKIHAGQETAGIDCVVCAVLLFNLALERGQEQIGAASRNSQEQPETARHRSQARPNQLVPTLSLEKRAEPRTAAQQRGVPWETWNRRIHSPLHSISPQSATVLFFSPDRRPGFIALQPRESRNWHCWQLGCSGDAVGMQPLADPGTTGAWDEGGGGSMGTWERGRVLHMLLFVQDPAACLNIQRPAPDFCMPCNMWPELPRR